jgi:hypothetical protein
MNTYNPKILIGTLFSGENELDQCIDSIKMQTYRNWDHRIFKYLGNKEAHDTLYSFFMDNKNVYDLFIKLDADMVFITPYELERIIELFNKEENLDHIIMGVKDWYSSLNIEGLHIFSSRASWVKNDEKLNVDTQPQIPGKMRIYVNHLSPIAYHSPNPSIEQAFQFGIHRTLKTFQFRKKTLNLFQWKLLKNSWDNYRSYGDIRHAYVLLGAETVLNNFREKEQVDYKLIKPKKNIDITYINKQLRFKWNNRIVRDSRFLRYAGIKKILNLIHNKVMRRTK